MTMSAAFSYICLAFLTFLPLVTNLFSFFLANIKKKLYLCIRKVIAPFPVAVFPVFRGQPSVTLWRYWKESFPKG